MKTKKTAEKEAAQTAKDIAKMMAIPALARLLTDEKAREAFNGKPGDEAALRLRLEAAERVCEFVDAYLKARTWPYAEPRDVTALRELVAAWTTAKEFSK